MAEHAEDTKVVPDLTYDRALSPAFEKLVSGSEPLLRLLRAPGRLNVKHDLPVTFDVQFRRGDEISFYAGLTKVLVLKRLDEDRLEASADASYEAQGSKGPGGAFGKFHPRELADRVAAWSDYLGRVKVRESQWRKEGAWQAWLAHRAFLGVPQPWTLFDREAELAGLSGENLAALKSAHDTIGAAAAQDPKFDRRGSPLKKSRGGGIDFLGLTPEGDIALVEVKHGSDAQGCYCTPIQVGGYAALWERALDAKRAEKNVLEGIRRLLKQKRRLGMLPGTGSGLASEPRIQPFVVIAEPNLGSQVWKAQGLLSRVWAAARAASETSRRTRTFICDSKRLTLREVTADLAAGKAVLPD